MLALLRLATILLLLGVILTKRMSPLVALIGGGALSMSAYALGAHQGSEPGTAPSDDAAFQRH